MNPFLSNTIQSNSNIKVNGISSNVFDNIPVPLSSLTDVYLSNVLNSQVLSYDSTLSKWINSDASGGLSNLDDLLDVNISSIANGNILKYDTATSKWINSNDIDNLSLLSDVNISNIANNQILKYDSTSSK